MKNKVQLGMQLIVKETVEPAVTLTTLLGYTWQAPGALRVITSVVPLTLNVPLPFPLPLAEFP